MVIDSLAQGGAEASTIALAPHLVDRGLELELVCLDERRHGAEGLEEAGVPVEVVGRGPAAWRRLVSAVVGADLVHTQLWAAHQYGRTAARRAGVPVVSSFTGTPYGPDWFGGSPRRRLGRAAAFRLDRATARLVRRFHAPARHVATTMAARLGIDPDHVDVIPRGRDPRRFPPRPRELTATERRRRSPVSVDPDRPLVVVVARHEPEKGVDVAIAAVAAWGRPLTLVVAGREGTATGELTTAAAAAPPGVEVRLVGAVHDVADLLAAADVCLLTSRREGLPGVLVEALAVTTPVVAVDIPGVREVLGDDLGVVVTPGDPAAVAAGIERVLGDDPPWDPAAARRRFEENFTLDRVAASTLAAYERVLSSPPPRPTGTR